MNVDEYIETYITNKKIKLKIISELSYRKKKLVFQYRILGNYRYMVCPTCNNDIDVDYINYCPVCGQRLSWYGSVKYKQRI